MIEAPLALAFGAGLVATMNPCGFAMLPAYLSFFMGLDSENTSRPAAVRRALVVGGVMSLSFLLVFGVFGLLITAGFRAVIDWIPWIALGIGGLVALLGIRMLFGFELTVGLPKAKRAGKGKDLRSVFAFGISYGLASLSCTLPVFLSVVATQLTTTSFVSGVATFIAYGVGMSMMLLAVTVAMAFGRQTIVRRLRSSVRYINRISGAVLVLAGAYIIWFWGTTLASGAGALNSSGAFRFTETLSQRATEIFGENALTWGLVLGALIAAAVIYTLLKSRTKDGGDGPAPRVGRRGRIIAPVAAAVVLTASVGGLYLGQQSSDGDATTLAMGATEELPSGPPDPVTEFTRFDGSTASFSDYRGRPVVVNFWASWCPSCVAELSAAIRPAQDRFGDRVAFVGINLQDERDRALELVEETGVRFDLAEDPNGSLYTQLEGIGMPFTVFISAEGEIVDDHNGPLTEGQLADRIEELLLTGAAAAEPADSLPADSVTPTPATTADVIVEADPDLPGRLDRLVGWATDWGRRTIDLEELNLGIPQPDPRDVIPPLDDPEFETVADAGAWLVGREPGVLLRIGDDARFFPLRIMTFHEVVNGRVGGRDVVVTFCPLCNTAVTFDPTVNGEVLRFGVSGLLRFSDLVMWDANTETLWQQITGEGIVGELAGTQLELLPSSIVSWDEFRNAFPNGPVLSRQTGFTRNYGVNPYEGYSSSSRPFLFDGEVDERFPALERVVGVSIGDADKAYPFSVISGPRVVNDELAGVPVAIFWGGDTADALDSSDITAGQGIGTGIAFARTVDGTVLTFEANDNDTFTDVETATTWDLLGNAIDGPLVGTSLDTLVHRNDFWFAWAAFNEGAPVFTG
jgi:cytochrome c biogenesis protein CcdA/thiol-disulfide isomerase/thioredoxin